MFKNIINIKTFTYNWFIFSVLVVISIIFYESFLEYEDSIDHTKYRSSNILIPISNRIEKDFQQAENILLIAEDILINLSENNTNFKNETLQEQKKFIIEKFKFLIGIFEAIDMLNFADKNGKVLYSSNDLTVNINTIHRKYFQDLKNDKSKNITFSNVLFSQATNTNVIVIAKAVRDKNDKFLGVLTALINIENITKVLSSVSLGKKGVALLRNSKDFELISRFPTTSKKFTNSSVEVPPIIRKKINQGEKFDSLEYIEPIDKKNRIGSFKVMDDYPFYVQVAFSKDEILIAWKQTLFVIIVVATLFIIGSIILLIYMRISYQKEKNLQNELHNEKERLEKAFSNLQKLIENQSSIIILTDGSKLDYANKKFFEFLGFKNLEDFKKHHQCICEFFEEDNRFFHLKKINENDNWVEKIKQLEEPQRIVLIKDTNSKEHIFSVSINYFDDRTIVINFTDISQTIQEKLHLETKIIHDKLTNAYNREFFEKNYANLISEYQTNNSRLAVAMLDIDHFKHVNDNFGHDVGDEILKSFVEVIKENSRKSDILIRWGGEEFILMLKIDSPNDLQKVLESLKDSIEAYQFGIVGKKTCSIGATLYENNEDIHKTIKRADEAVYKAKELGRNKVVIF